MSCFNDLTEAEKQELLMELYNRGIISSEKLKSIFFSLFGSSGHYPHHYKSMLIRLFDLKIINKSELLEKLGVEGLLKDG